MTTTNLIGLRYSDIMTDKIDSYVKVDGRWIKAKAHIGDDATVVVSQGLGMPEVWQGVVSNIINGVYYVCAGGCFRTSDQGDFHKGHITL